jgi:hypothetical protein
LRTLSAGHTQDAERCQALLKFFESGEAVPLEPLSPGHNAVLRTLFVMIHPDDFSLLWISHLTDKVNRFLEQSGERLRLLPRKVGAVLTSFGFTNRMRTNSGWVLYLSQRDAEKLHQLAACYGIDGFNDRFLSMSPEGCALCRAAGLHGDRRSVCSEKTEGFASGARTAMESKKGSWEKEGILEKI